MPVVRRHSRKFTSGAWLAEGRSRSASTRRRGPGGSFLVLIGAKIPPADLVARLHTSPPAARDPGGGPAQQRERRLQALSHSGKAARGKAREIRKPCASSAPSSRTRFQVVVSSTPSAITFRPWALAASIVLETKLPTWSLRQACWTMI